MLFCLCYALLLVPLYYLMRYFLELPKVSDLTNKAILITGCDSGFGRLLALKCANHGMTVIAGCSTTEGRESLNNEGEELHGTIHTVNLDVASQESVDKAVISTEMKLSGGLQLWALVNNAGSLELQGPDDWCSIADYDRSLKNNTLGHIRVVHAFRHLLERSKGRIVTVITSDGRLASLGASTYSVAMLATDAYINALRRQVRPFGITCSTIELGMFCTAFFDSTTVAESLESSWERLTHNKKAKYGEEYKNKYIAGVEGKIQKSALSQIDRVVDIYYHAITARFPRVQYYCGLGAYFMSFARHLPTKMSDTMTAFLTTTNATPEVLLTEKKQQ